MHFIAFLCYILPLKPKSCLRLALLVTICPLVKGRKGMFSTLCYIHMCMYNSHSGCAVCVLYLYGNHLPLLHSVEEYIFCHVSDAECKLKWCAPQIDKQKCWGQYKGCNDQLDPLVWQQFLQTKFETAKLRDQFLHLISLCSYCLSFLWPELSLNAGISWVLQD